MREDVITTISASMGRRILGITSMGVLGVLVISICFVAPPAPGLIVFLLALGIASLAAAEKMRRDTNLTIELTATELRDSSGAVLVTLDNISGIDRGVFAFKPSNGFLLKTKTPDSRVWRPGLWWRFGRRIGVGGMTPGSETKFVADYIATYVAEREDR